MLRTPNQPRRGLIRAATPPPNVWGPNIRSWALIRANAAEADQLCPVFSTASSPCSPVSRSALVVPRTSRSSCSATNSASSAARSTDPYSTTPTGLCSAPSPLHSPAHDEQAESSPPTPCSDGTVAASPVTGHRRREDRDAHRPRSRSAESSSASLPRTRPGAIAASTANSPASVTMSPPPRSGRSSKPAASNRHRAGPRSPGRSSCTLRPPWPATSSPSTLPCVLGLTLCR